jgi:hypothetical protein
MGAVGEERGVLGERGLVWGVIASLRPPSPAPLPCRERGSRGMLGYMEAL